MSWASELRREGRLEGRLEGLRDLLRDLGAQRFGAPSEDRVSALDLVAVEAAVLRLLTATSWDELLNG